MKETIEMRISSVNLGPVRVLESHGDPVRSAIDKSPRAGRIRIDDGGLHGDEIEDARYHGGVDQAVYVYSSNDYAWWARELGREFRPGTFGENLTIDGLPSDPLIGDRLMIGRVILEITGPRIPCHKLGLIVQDDSFPSRFLNAMRPGAYCRVLNAGSIEAGDVVSLVPTSDESVSLTQILRLNNARPADPETLRRALATPLAHRLRKKFESRQKKA